MKRRTLLKVALASLMAGAAPIAIRAADGKSADPGDGEGGRRRKAEGIGWNLLFITADDLDASLVGYMGGPPGLTPNLDRLAARSQRFHDCRTVAPICMPSREAFMTGLLPHRSGGLGFTPVQAGTLSLTTVLRTAGYFTAAFHKTTHMQPPSSFPWHLSDDAKTRNTLVLGDGARIAFAEAKSQGQPFFVQCNVDDPHRPFYGSAPALRMDEDNEGPFVVPNPVSEDDVVMPPQLEDLPPIRKELLQYYRSVQRLDMAVGHILDALDDSGEAVKTIVVFCADHGMPFPFAKATCGNYGTHVPMLISWPGMGPPADIAWRTTNLDLLPTLLELLKLEAPGPLDGRSWLPGLTGGPAAEPAYVFTYVNTVASGAAYPERAIQNDAYSMIFAPWSDGKLERKLESMSGLSFDAMVAAAKTDAKIAARVQLYVYGEPIQLYDRKADPGERVNLAADPAHADTLKAMQVALLAEMRRTGDPQLSNYQAFLAGKSMSVPQPSRSFLSGWADE